MDLTKKQIAWLDARGTVGISTDQQATKTVGISGSTLWRWRQMPHFLERYNALIQSITDRALLVQTPEDHMKEMVPVAIQRIEEILGIQITDETNAQKIGQIRQVATEVLQSEGILRPEQQNPQSITNIVNLIAAEARDHAPAWGEPPAIEGEATVVEDPSLPEPETAHTH